MLMLDFVSKRYGTLPSILMREGNTFDLYIADLAASYQKFITDKENKSRGGLINPPSTPHPSQEEMMAMIARVRGKKNDDKA